LYVFTAAAVGTQKAVMVKVAGSYRIKEIGQRGFTQDFVITAQSDNKWKIASNTFRTQHFPIPNY